MLLAITRYCNSRKFIKSMLVNDVYEEKNLRQIFLLWLNIHYYEVGRMDQFLA